MHLKYSLYFSAAEAKARDFFRTRSTHFLRYQVEKCRILRAVKCSTTHFHRESILNITRFRSAGNVTVITRNIPRNLRVGKIENYA